MKSSLAATLALLSAAALPITPAAAQSTGGCDWRESSVNLAYPETNARYYTASLPQRPPAGSRIRIEGLYPDARYFSFQTYNGSYMPIDTLADHEVSPEPGSAATWIDRTRSNPEATSGGRYTLYVNYERFPAARAANTLYTNAGPNSFSRFLLIHRTYLENGPIRLPKIVLETPTGDRPLSASSGTNCGQTTPFELRWLPDLSLFGLSLGGLFGLAPPPSINWQVYYETSSTNEGFGLNQDARYMFANVSNNGSVILVRGRAPTVREQSETTPELPDARYWSICQNDRRSTLVTACASDRDVPIDADGYFNLVIADDGLVRLPPGAGFRRLPFGPSLEGFLIYRQLLAGTGFVGSIDLVPRDVPAATVIGDYAPVSVYCPTAVFQARINAGDTPGQVYSACAAR